MEKSITDKQMMEAYSALDNWQKETNEYNKKILSELGGTAIKDFKILIEDCKVTDKIDFVEKPSGQNQNEKCGIFKNTWVDQSSYGDSGDSYAGYIYAEITKNKWLRIPYEC